MSRKLKIANLVLAIVLSPYFLFSVGGFDQPESFPVFIVLLISQIFLFVYAIKDFFREGRASWFVFGMIPSFYLLLILSLQDLIDISASTIGFDTIFNILAPLAVIIFYLTVAINKINYWKKLEEIHE